MECAVRSGGRWNTEGVVAAGWRNPFGVGNNSADRTQRSRCGNVGLQGISPSRNGARVGTLALRRFLRQKTRKERAFWFRLDTEVVPKYPVKALCV